MVSYRHSKIKIAVKYTNFLQDDESVLDNAPMNEDRTIRRHTMLQRSTLIAVNNVTQVSTNSDDNDTSYMG